MQQQAARERKEEERRLKAKVDGLNKEKDDTIKAIELSLKEKENEIEKLLRENYKAEILNLKCEIEALKKENLLNFGI